MFVKLNRGFVIWGVLIVLYAGFSLCHGRDAYAFTIDAKNVKEIALYGQASDFGKGLEPDQLVFNVTDPATISDMIAAIQFSEELDCSGLGSHANAYVYIKYNDSSIEIYDFFGLYSHVSKLGMRGSCYYITEQGRSLFENNTQ